MLSSGSLPSVRLVPERKSTEPFVDFFQGSEAGMLLYVVRRHCSACFQWVLKSRASSSFIPFWASLDSVFVDASCSAVLWLCSALLLWGISAALSASLSCTQAVASHVSSGWSHFLVIFCGYWYSGEQFWPRVCDPDLRVQICEAGLASTAGTIHSRCALGGGCSGDQHSVIGHSEGDQYSWWCKSTAEAKKLGISGSQHTSQHFLMPIINYLCLPAYTGKHYDQKSCFVLRSLILLLTDRGIPGSELQLLSSTQFP